MKYTACAFTGHRNIKPEHKPEIHAFLMRAIKYAYDNGCRRFYAGGALGFDTLAAEAVIEFRISNSDVSLGLILPCKNQTERWADESIEKYECILKAADSIEYTAERYYDGCMKRRNTRLVELSDVIIAYCGRSFGGSAQTVRMAKAAGREVFNLYPSLDKGNA